MTSSYSCGIAHSGTSLRSNVSEKPVQVLQWGTWKVIIDEGKPWATDRELQRIYEALGISERSNSTGIDPSTGIGTRSKNPEINVGLVETSSTEEGRHQNGSRMYTLEEPLAGRKVDFRADSTRGSAPGVFRTEEEMMGTGTECDVVYGRFVFSALDESGTGGSHRPEVTIRDPSMGSQHGTRASTEE